MLCAPGKVTCQLKIKINNRTTWLGNPWFKADVGIKYVIVNEIIEIEEGEPTRECEAEF